MEGLAGKYQSFVRDLSFWPALHTPQQFLKKCKGLITYYALFEQLAARRVRRV
jgi:hypothetical protein